MTVCNPMFPLSTTFPRWWSKLAFWLLHHHWLVPGARALSNSSVKATLDLTQRHDVSSPLQVTDRSVQAVAEHCPELQFVGFMGCPVTSQGVIHLTGVGGVTWHNTAAMPTEVLSRKYICFLLCFNVFHMWLLFFFNWESLTNAVDCVLKCVFKAY
jgi:hypothetical protein